MKLHLIEDSRIINPISGIELKLGDKSIKQGSSFTLVLAYEGNYEFWTPIGAIKNNYLSKGGNLLAEFSFPPLTYNDTSDKTTVICNISANDTLSLPPTVYQGGPVNQLNVRNAYVYEIRLVHPTDNSNVLSLIEPSFVQVKPGVIKND